MQPATACHHHAPYMIAVSVLWSTGMETRFLLSSLGMEMAEGELRMSHLCSAIARLKIALMALNMRRAYTFGKGSCKAAILSGL